MTEKDKDIEKIEKNIHNSSKSLNLLNPIIINFDQLKDDNKSVSIKNESFIDINKNNEVNKNIQISPSCRIYSTETYNYRINSIYRPNMADSFSFEVPITIRFYNSYPIGQNITVEWNPTHPLP